MQRRSSFGGGSVPRRKPALRSHSTSDSFGGVMWNAAKSVIGSLTSPARRPSREDNKENDRASDSQSRVDHSPRFGSQPRNSQSRERYDQRNLTTPTNRRRTASRLDAEASSERRRENSVDIRNISPVQRTPVQETEKLSSLLHSIDSMGLTPMQRRRLAKELLRDDTESMMQPMGALDGDDETPLPPVSDQRVPSPYHRPTVIARRASPARTRFSGVSASPFRSPIPRRRGGRATSYSMNRMPRRSLSAWSTSFSRGIPERRATDPVNSTTSAFDASGDRSSSEQRRQPPFSSVGRKRKRRELLDEEEDVGADDNADDQGGVQDGLVDQPVPNVKRMRPLMSCKEEVMFLSSVITTAIQNAFAQQNQANQVPHYLPSAQVVNTDGDSPMQRLNNRGILAGLHPSDKSLVLSQIQAHALTPMFDRSQSGHTLTQGSTNSSSLISQTSAVASDSTAMNQVVISNDAEEKDEGKKEEEKDVDQSMNDQSNDDENEEPEQQDEEGDEQTTEEDTGNEEEDSATVSFAMKLMQQRTQNRYDEMKRRMKRIYSEHNPAKLDNLDMLCLRYHSTLYELYCKVCAKYNLEPNPDWDGDEHTECVQTAEKEISSQAPPTLADTQSYSAEAPGSSPPLSKPADESASVASGADSKANASNTFGDENAASSTSTTFSWGGTSDASNNTGDPSSNGTMGSSSSSSALFGGWGSSESEKKPSDDSNSSPSKPAVSFGESNVITFGTDTAPTDKSGSKEEEKKSSTEGNSSSSGWGDSWGSSNTSLEPKKDTAASSAPQTTSSWDIGGFGADTKKADATKPSESGGGASSDWGSAWGSSSSSTADNKTADGSSGANGWSVPGLESSSNGMSSAWSASGSSGGWGSSSSDSGLSSSAADKKDESNTGSTGGSGWGGWGSTATALTDGTVDNNAVVSGWDSKSTADSWNLGGSSTGTSSSSGSGGSGWGSTWNTNGTGSSSNSGSGDSSSNGWSSWNSSGNSGGSGGSSSGWGAPSSSDSGGGWGSSAPSNASNTGGDSGGFSFQAPTGDLTLSGKKKRKVVKGRKHSFGR